MSLIDFQTLNEWILPIASLLELPLLLSNTKFTHMFFHFPAA